jgi:excisionase family DNA binding protein
MAQTSDSPYLTVPEVANALGMSTDGVYKLIRRDKLPALRLSERGLRVTRWALEAYRESLNGRRPDTSLPEDDVDDRWSAFEQQTGLSPREWVSAWKADVVTDSAENNALLVQALALLAVQRSTDDRLIAALAENAARRPATMALCALWAINGFLQGRLRDLGRPEVSALEAACWLDDAGLLRDSETRPGLPLRNLLRAGQIMGADQRPARRYGRWFITRA